MQFYLSKNTFKNKQVKCRGFEHVLMYLMLIHTYLSIELYYPYI